MPPRARLPIPLKVLLWTLVGLSIFGLGLETYRWNQGQDLRMSRLFHGSYQLWAAIETLRRRRHGIDHLISASWLGAVLVLIALILLGFALGQIPGVIWFAIPWLIFLLVYLRHCRRVVRWIGDEEGSALLSFFEQVRGQLARDRQSPPDLEALARDLRDEDQAQTAILRLEALGSQAWPILLAALRDPKVRDQDDILALCIGLLPMPLDPSMAPILAECCAALPEEEMCDAMRSLASSGSLDYVEVIAAGLESPTTGTETAEGLQEAFRSEQREPRFAHRLRPLLEALRADLEDEDAAYAADQALRLLDPASAGAQAPLPRPQDYLSLRIGDTLAKLRLAAYDDPEELTAPTGFDTEAALRSLQVFISELSRELQARLEATPPQPAGEHPYVAELPLPESCLRGAAPTCLRVSKFGGFLAALPDESGLRPTVLQTIRDQAPRHGYVFVPARLHQAAYDGPIRGAQAAPTTIGTRFFGSNP